jgi:uncharacterized protein YebE (UPF0316 family)
MNTSLLITFVALNIVNVIIQTVKSIATVKCGKTVAAIVNAIAYGLYTVVVVYTVCDLPLWFKVVVVGVANLIGVYVVKFCEEKAQKEKLWKIEATIDWDIDDNVKRGLTDWGIPYNYIELGSRWTIFNVYCSSKEQSAKAKRVLDAYGAKYFVSESKTLS